MPIRILCPEGCRFIAPIRQAGRQVRCPKCRTVLRLPELGADVDASGERLVILNAMRVGDSLPEVLLATPEPEGPPVVVPPKAPAAPATFDPPIASPIASPVTSPLTTPIASTVAVIPSLTASLSSADGSAVQESAVQESAVKTVESETLSQRSTDSIAPALVAEPIRSEPIVSEPAVSEPAVSESAPSEITLSQPVTVAASVEESMTSRSLIVSTELKIDPTKIVVQTMPEIRLDEQRLAVFEVRRHQAIYETTRRSIARIIAFCILILGLTNIFMGVWQSGWLTNPATAQLQAWAIVLIFIGALHAAYAALLAQVGDWSAHWVSAAFLLGIAMFAAAAAVVLGVARPDHLLIRWLELPRILQLKGAIWSLCMVMMAASLAWWCGREALLWRRTISRFRAAEEA